MTIRTTIVAIALAVAAFGAPRAGAQSDGEAFRRAAGDAERRLEESVKELDALRQRILAEKLPLSRRLSELEDELAQVRSESLAAKGRQNSRALDLSELQNEIRAREEEVRYVTNLLGDYIRQLKSRLHIVERQRYGEAIDVAEHAPENGELTESQVLGAQSELLLLSVDRIDDLLGGAMFDGSAVASSGLVRKGRYVLVGPYALFRSADGDDFGTAEERLGGSLEPTIYPFADPLDGAAATELARTGEGTLPLDPTLGNAHKIEATQDTFVEHVKKGGPVMIPIFALAGAALLVAVVKWVSFLFVRSPSRKRVRRLLAAVAEGDRAEAQTIVRTIRGPVGRMLAAGVAHLGEPRELVEEIMYETVLVTRLRLNRMLPFIGICAASAPLLGLLGTVTGIINTFKLITVYGSGDVKTLSGGISEALITTEFGLIVAIPSLLLHAYLSRRARSVVDQMERAGVSLVNQVGLAPAPAPAPPVRSVAPSEVLVGAGA